MKKSFKPAQLGICNYQYQIKHQSVSCFEVGETVFLVSNPEWPLIVYNIKNINEITVISDVGEKISLPPQCLLQYKYRGLLIWKKQLLICLN